VVLRLAVACFKYYSSIWLDEEEEGKKNHETPWSNKHFKVHVLIVRLPSNVTGWLADCVSD
jgi:hypothetical protein